MKNNRILLTGAAGSLGTVLRPELSQVAASVRLNDVADIRDPAQHEEIIQCDLNDVDAVYKMTRDVDMVIHMGGACGEKPFAEILHSNITGFYNLFEGCRKNSVKRIIWGSSNHAVGMHPRVSRLSDSARPRPDSNYGVSKVWGEAMAQMYWDKFGIECVSIRIGSCFQKPVDRRMLNTWLSFPDLVHLVECCVTAPRVEHTVIYGVSNNDAVLWDNSHAAHIGYKPKSNGEAFRAEVEAATRPYHHDDKTISCHGGSLAAQGHIED